MKTKKKGFTIIELIVVMAVIGVLVLLTMPKFMGYTKKAKLTSVMNNLKVFESASELYYMDYDEWPRLDDRYYTADEIKEYAKSFYSNTGFITNLDVDGRYYLIDFEKLHPYIKANDIKGLYILQNPVGSVYYATDFTAEGHREFKEAKDDVLADSKFDGDIIPPVINNILIDDKTIIIEATDNKDENIEYFVTAENISPSKNDGGWKKDNSYTVETYGNYYVFVKDKSGNISSGAEVIIADGTKPVVNNVIIEDKKLTIEATDNILVSEYAISLNDSNVDLAWTNKNIITAPSYNTYYIFAKDNVGNISDSYEINVVDNIKPIINNVSIEDRTITIDATDNESTLIYGYSNTNDVSGVSKWIATNVITIDIYSNYFVFAKDAAGNISDSFKVSVSDKIKPSITNIVVNDKTITIEATDNLSVTHYGFSSVNDSGSVSSWQTNNAITVSNYGEFFVFVKDASGNISDGRSTIIKDEIRPTISGVTAVDKVITITASDNIGITGYGLSATNNSSGVGVWSASNILTANGYSNYYIFAKDAAGNISDGKQVTTVDGIKPTISSVTASDKTITITASDNVGVTSYGISTTNNSSVVANWGASNVITATNYDTYYVFAKDANGNISDGKSVTTADGVKPTISSVTASDKVVTISATDNVGVTGYGISSTNSSSGVSNWGTSNIITAPGYGTYYVFAKDARGNISDVRTITTIDGTKPIISNVTASDKVITITATDNVGVSSYGLSTTNSSSGVGTWQSSNIITAPSYGPYYVFAKDARGNISDGKVVTTSDGIAPIISNVTTKNYSMSTDIIITATDNIKVTHYGYSTTNNSNTVSSWTTSNTSTIPAYTTYYVFAKDANGNISAGYKITVSDTISPSIHSAFYDRGMLVISAVDNVGIVSYGYGTLENSSSAYWSSDGNNRISVPRYPHYYIFAKDAAGNISAYYYLYVGLYENM